MHIKHLGVDQWYYGSVLQYLHEDFGIDVEELSQEIRAGYDRRFSPECRFKRFVLTMFAHEGALASLRDIAKECCYVVQPLMRPMVLRSCVAYPPATTCAFVRLAWDFVQSMFAREG